MANDKKIRPRKLTTAEDCSLFWEFFLGNFGRIIRFLTVLTILDLSVSV